MIDDDAVRAAIAAQVAAGLDLLSDGRFRPLIDLWNPDASFVPDWQFAAACSDRPVKAVLPGPYASARRLEPVEGRLRASALELAERLRSEVLALAEAGCSLVEIDEPDAAHAARHRATASAFREAHVRLATDLPVHLSLALGGGNVDIANGGVRTFLDPPYASYAVDLIAGPENWRLVVEVPRDRGVVCGALSPVAGANDGPDLLVWAAHYAASTGRRGLERVGLANAPGLSALPWDVAVGKLEKLGVGARVAALPRGEALRSALDPRATDLKSRAIGRHARRSRPASARRPPMS